MAAKRKSGRVAAEAAFADLMKESRTLVGDVGVAYESLVAKLADAAEAQKIYEEARGAAVKGGAVTNDQLDQMGYRKTPKLTTLPSVAANGKTVADKAETPSSANGSRPDPARSSQHDPELASVSAHQESTDDITH